ncbi:MAG: VOC family protein [Gammaproteobacteria bacterium]|nr:VOC family protein [Gammaproteobacteria bacterium]
MPNDPLKYHGIDHVVLKVTAIEPSLAFYTGVLGMKLERIISDAGIYQLRCGRNLLDLQVLPSDRSLAAPECRGIDHMCLLLDGDFDRVLAHLASHGIPIAWGPLELYGATGFGTSVYVSDPDGHVIELKADHALAPLRTTAKEALASLTRPTPKPRN